MKQKKNRNTEWHLGESCFDFSYDRHGHAPNRKMPVSLHFVCCPEHQYQFENVHADSQETF